ncbi:LrgB family protein [Anoxybacillus flavithermus NBRC 109594]|uniref:LrgB family protein n=1 Tax=Anoxybacillus flavithermus NBRC 109594 TaxID=1315967 RepID=R4FBV0_9BACL|nr:LrgB family protein [Anoxybacillus flavithermus]GAC90956.1 LrgB family protein [Anoxybacillus flavithermus NBRC 109594]
MIGASMLLWTIVVYMAMRKLYARFYFPLLVPIATSTLVIIITLSLFHLSYEQYMSGGKWLVHLLGPAVVALALPLYQHRQTLKQFLWPLLCSTFFGTIIGMGSGLLLARLFHLPERVVRSIIPKSVTSPVAMDIAKLIDGIPTLAAVYVMVAGIFGAMFGPTIFQRLRLTTALGIGSGLGAASHGIGTAKALEIGKKEAAISSVAMTLSAIFASLLCPLLLLL